MEEVDVTKGLVCEISGLAGKIRGHVIGTTRMGGLILWTVTKPL
jgi:hypothetical protein